MIFCKSTFEETYFEFESLSHVFGEGGLAALCRDVFYSVVEVFENEVHNGVAVSAFAVEDVTVAYVNGLLCKNYIAVALYQLVVLTCTVEACEAEIVCFLGCSERRTFYALNHEVGTADFFIRAIVGGCRRGNRLKCPVVDSMATALVIAEPAEVECAVCGGSVSVAVVVVVEGRNLVLYVYGVAPEFRVNRLRRQRVAVVV